VKRYKKRLQDKKGHLDYMKKEKLEILEESDLAKVSQAFQRAKQQRESGKQKVGNAKRKSVTARMPKLAGSGSGQMQSARKLPQPHATSSARQSIKRQSSKSGTVLFK